MSSLHFCDPVDNTESYLYPIGLTTGTFSLIGCFMVIFIYLRFYEARNYTYLLILQVAIGDLINTIGNFVNLGKISDTINSTDTKCILQGFLSQFGSLSSILWTMIISYALYATLVLRKANVSRGMTRLLLFGYGVPLLAAFIPYWTGDYGSAGHWCWITLENSSVRGNILRFSLFYVPLWTVIVYNCYLYYKIIQYLNQLIPGAFDDSLVTRLRFYPLILVVCYLWSTIYQVVLFADCTANLAFLNILSVAFKNLVGFFNAMAYGFNENIQHILKQKIRLFCNWVGITKGMENKEDGMIGVELGNTTYNSRKSISGDLDSSFASDM